MSTTFFHSINWLYSMIEEKKVTNQGGFEWVF